MKHNQKTKLPISAIVVGFNEFDLLNACFDSVDFCDEIIYLDLGSTDASAEMADGPVVTVHKVTRHLAVEAVVAENINLVRNRWVLLIDPDERISRELATALGRLSLAELEERHFSAISVPWQFYCKSKKLKGTPWGGRNRKSIIFDTDNCRFVPDVHNGKILASGTGEFSIYTNGTNNLDHLWIRSWREGIAKHVRYANLEREKLGASWTLLLPIYLCVEWVKRFVESFVLCRGYRDLRVGFLLSILWATYHVLIKTPMNRKWRYEGQVS